MLRKDLHEANRLAWNAVTPVHNSHKQDQAQFFRAGGSTLFPEEVELVGEVSSLSLVHLQCNCGQDTLSLARMGATVTGVDISDEAIEFARQLSQEAGISGTFLRSDLYDWFAEAGDQRFDVVFCSYGALCWLSDIQRWAQGIATVLKPSGRFAMIDFHPFAMVFDEEWKLKYPYSGAVGPHSFEEGVGDYVAMSESALAPMGYQQGVQGFRNPNPSHEWQWGIGEVVTALLEAGLTLTMLKEYPYSNGAVLFEGMREMPGKRMVPPEHLPSLPLMYGLVGHLP